MCGISLISPKCSPKNLYARIGRGSSSGRPAARGEFPDASEVGRKCRGPSTPQGTSLREVPAPLRMTTWRIMADDGENLRIPTLVYTDSMSEPASKTFYLETFGCQMNAHDSEKVVGTLLQQGYRQVPTVEEAGLVLYNTCSIRDKAEQKVFNRLADYKKYRSQGKQFGVLGCVAQQEGEKIFERAPYVSLVCGSASYRNLPQMLVQLETGGQRVTGLDDRANDKCFETEYTARTNPHRGYITIIEGCDKCCAY